ncbi:MAG: ABC transporter permease [Pseudomonadota bacterium]
MKLATPPTTPPQSVTKTLRPARAIVALILREMSSSYGRTPGGYIWALAEPVAGIALLSAVFSAAFQTPALGLSFALFYATGMVPFSMFNGLSQKLTQALNFSRQLLAYPAVTLADALVARLILNLMVELLTAVIVFSGIILLIENRAIVDVAQIALALGLAAALATGIGVLNCYLVMRFPAWQQVWSILMKPMFVISCVFFLFDTVPQPFRDWLWWNPIVHVIGIMRRGFYAGYTADYASITYVAGIATMAFVIGLAMLKRDARSLLTR